MSRHPRAPREVATIGGPPAIDPSMICRAPEDIHPEAGWVLETEVKPGDILIADDGFTCLNAGQRCTVSVSRKLHRLPELVVVCRDGSHFLDGQLDEQGRYVGFTLAQEGGR